MYDGAAAYLARTHVIAPPGSLDAFVSPPAVAMLALPVALLPREIAGQAWTALDGAAILASLILLYLLLPPRHRLAAPLFWLLAAAFPPLLADVRTGHRGGVPL